MPVYFPTTARAVFSITGATGPGGCEFIGCNVDERLNATAREMVERAKTLAAYPTGSDPAFNALLKEALQSAPEDFLLRIERSPWPPSGSESISLIGTSFQGAVCLGFLAELLTKHAKDKSPGFGKWNPMIVVSAQVDGIRLAPTDDIDTKWKAVCRLAADCASADHLIRFCFAGNENWKPGENETHSLDDRELAASKFLIATRVADLPELVRVLFDDYQAFSASKQPSSSSIPPAGTTLSLPPARRGRRWLIAAASAAVALLGVVAWWRVTQALQVAAAPTAGAPQAQLPAPSSAAATPAAVPGAAEPSATARPIASPRHKTSSNGAKPPVVEPIAAPRPLPEPPPVEPPQTPPPARSARPAKSPRAVLTQEGEER